MIGTIELLNMEFWACHGCYELEKVVGNRFLVDVWIDAEIGAAARQDDVTKTVNYLTVYEIVRAQVAQRSDTIENVCLRVVEAIREAFPDAASVKVRVNKMAPSLGGKVERASVTLKA